MKIFSKFLTVLGLTFWISIGSATIINFTCPLPNKIEFLNMENHDYLAMAEVNMIKPKDYPAFSLQGVTAIDQVFPLTKVIYQRNHLDCYYGQEAELNLSTDNDMELAYCYFINGSKIECLGDPMQCELSCDVN